MNSSLTVSAALFKALAHPSRLRLLAMLSGGELCVCQVAALLGSAYSTVSSHLAELRRAGLIAERKDGRWVYYRLAGGTDSDLVAQALEKVGADPQVAADRELLKRLCCLSPEDVCAAERNLERLGLAPTGSGEAGGGER